MADDASIAQYAVQRYGLRGQKALVTGGSKGIGAAIVEHYARLGAKVITCARSAGELEAKLAAWQGEGLTVQGIPVDLSKEEDRQQLVQFVRDTFEGELHILVNNVGTNIRKPTVEYSADDYEFLMATNLESAYRMCQLTHPLLKAARNSCVLFNSSVAGGPTALRSGSIYAMTKASMNQLAKNLACEWAGDGVRVNSVGTWYTATDLALQVLQNEEFKKEVLSRTPLQRIATTDEVADMFAFLASPAAAYITGQTYAVDGGYTIKGLF